MDGPWVRLFVLAASRSRRRGCGGGFNYVSILFHIEPRLFGEKARGRKARSRREERFVKHLRRGQCEICSARLTKMSRALCYCHELDRLGVIPMPVRD